MTVFSLELNATEIQTRELFNSVLEGEGWSPLRVGIAKVFVREWYASLTVDRVARQVAVQEGYQNSNQELAEEVQKRLTQFVTQKVLRSRVVSGVRNYEVNY